jgi:leucyl-tRNA synthetase
MMSSGDSVSCREFLKKIEEKWQRKWEETGAFNAEPDRSKPKFFANYPYSYMNGRPHVGHTFTLMRVEIFTRYKRMKGYNVLFPFAFHWTGTPIVAAAQRVKQGEPGQIRILHDMGVEEARIQEFSEPLKWASHFTGVWETDIRAMGMGIDWRRKFHTTSHNPHYDRFVQWQFRKLKEKKYIALGSHPVIWCPRCNAPVGDHDRDGAEGQRITPVEYTLLKFGCGDLFLIAATLRPETIYGQTNLWVDPQIEYVKARVGNETWVVSRECLAKLQAQGHETATETGRITGRELIGRHCIAPGVNREIPVLPSDFTESDMGTGIVTSVPSDAPDDWMALSDLQKSPDECKKFGLDPEDVKKIQPIAIIKSKGFGDFPAVEVCVQLGIKDQNDRANLEKAKELVYKAGFYTGVMNESCGEYSGIGVSEAKELIKEKLTREGRVGRMHEPSADVTCRCLTKAIVRLVANQWFIRYGDEGWKRLVKTAFEGGEVSGKHIGKMSLYPELVRKQFHYVIDWLGDWACTREYGLGSHLSWDEKWVIESLSDSTIYMAYYTIAKHIHHLKLVPPEKLTDAFFDYVFLTVGDPARIEKETGISADRLRQMHSEFDYWYPFDFRNSGKELVQNHLTFCIFNHVAIFPPGKWPRGIGVNGWVLVSGQKMSKSKGTSIFLRDLLDEYGADATRLALGHGGEGLDDPAFDPEFAEGAVDRLMQWYNFSLSNYGKGRDGEKPIDRWFLSRMAELVRDAEAAMEETRFRTALKYAYFDLQGAFRWYSERCGSAGASREVQNAFIETQTLLLASFVPHVCEEIWERIGKKGLVSFAAYPKCDEKKLDEDSVAAEAFLKAVIDDTAEILKIFKGTPKTVVYYTAPAWKRAVFERALKMHQSCTGDGGKMDIGTLIKALLADPALKLHAKDIPKFAQKCADDLRKMSPGDLKKRAAKIDEPAYLGDAREFLQARLGLSVKVQPADAHGIDDKSGKAGQAAPWRPGIYIE